MPKIVQLRGVSKSYARKPAVIALDLGIEQGTFFTLLGPSGSGKTTTLRLIAGFEFPDTGEILLNGRNVALLPPNKRDANTVFQDYALFPHMTLLQNVEYGLRAKRVPAAEAHTRAEAALAQVQLADFASRRPAQLSGGQRQRVALARAIVNRPAVLLLDEPLGALDLKLRHQMQAELKMLQTETGITFIYVTHDQEEALTMSDRIAVFNHGRIEQVGSPAEIYERPSSEFVAGFVGSASLLRRSGALLMLRPENIRLHAPDCPPAANVHAEPGTILQTQYLGTTTRVLIALQDGAHLLAHANPAPKPGAQILAAWSKEAAYVLP